MKSRCSDLILHTARLEELQEAEVGGKAWNLYRLHALGFSVPDWLVVSSRVFQAAVGPHRLWMEEECNRIDFSDQSALGEAAARLQERLFQAEIPISFKRQLLFMVSGLFGEEALLSVRSSVLGEDSRENSFAGQMDSFLNVSLVEIVDAVKRVWASAFSARALLYRHHKKLNFSNVSTAVIIQKMVPPTTSGVLFTHDPETRAKTCLISAGFGLGEGIVSNAVETDTYRIEWSANKIEKALGVKETCLVFHPNGNGRNGYESVPTRLQQKPALTDEQIRLLRKQGIKAEKGFGLPLDIEWAFDRQGCLHFLQARPIVFTDKKESRSTRRIWDNSNIVESYPGLTLPLTFSFILKAYEICFRNAALGFLASRRAIQGDLSIFKNMIGLLDGRVYYNLLNWYQMLSYLPGFKQHKKSWDQMIGISEQIEFPKSRLSSLNALFSTIVAAWKLLTVHRNAEIFFRCFNPAYARYKKLDFSAASEEELIETYEAMGRALTDKWHLTLYNDFCAMKYYDWLKQLCRRWGLGKYPNLHNNLLCGNERMESIKPVRALLQLAQQLRTHPDGEALRLELDDLAVWEKIRSQTSCAAIRTSLEKYLEEFGDRGLEELKLETPSFREEPARLIPLIRKYAETRMSEKDLAGQEQTIREEAEGQVRQSLKNPFKRALFYFVLRRASAAIAQRENMRFARTRLYGIVKRLFRRLGLLFAQKGLLEAKEDIHYLTVEEIFGFVQGTALTQNLKAVIELRKSEYADFASRRPAERIQTEGSPYLSRTSNVDTSSKTNGRIMGIGCSSGMSRAPARVIVDPRRPTGNGDYILVAQSTDPAWVFLMVSSKGIVVEKGSVLSHTAIIGRELGIPTVVGAKDATRQIPNGAQVSLNGTTGEIRWE